MKEQALVVGDVAAHLLDGVPLCGVKSSARLTGIHFFLFFIFLFFYFFNFWFYLYILFNFANLYNVVILYAITKLL